LRCRFDEGVEHGLKIESRAADDLEHVGSSDLLLSRLFQLTSEVSDLLLEFISGSRGDHAWFGKMASLAAV